jgi:hypothetical protein
MAINISNIGDDWCIKFYREEWYFKSVDEFSPVFEFLLDNNVSFNCCVKQNGFSVSMVDVNLKSFDYPNMLIMNTKCLSFKKLYGDKLRLLNIF